MTSPFNLARIDFAWLPILPLLSLALAAIVVLLVGVRVDDEDSDGLGLLSLAALAVAFVLTSFTLLGQNSAAFAGSLADRRLYARFF